MKKVLILATVYSHIGQFHQPLINMLKENGYEIDICGFNNLKLKNGLTINNVNKRFDIPFSRNPFSLKNLICYFKLYKIIQNEKYDIIHCNTPVGGFLGRLAAKKARKEGTKIIYTAHGFHFYNGSSKINWLIYYPIEKYLSKFTDYLITINKEDYDLSIKKFNNCKNIIYVNGVGVDEKKFNIYMNDDERKNYFKELNINDKDFIMICIGELNENKNQELAIRGLSKLITNNQNIKLLLLGNGPKKEFLNYLIEQLKLQNNVFTLGYRRDIPQLLKISNLGISCSKREGLPLNIVEELTSGIPVIAVDNRGSREIINNNMNGFLIKNNVDDFINKVKLLFDDTELYNQIKSNCYNSAKKFFLSNYLDAMLKLYESIDKTK